MTQSKKGISALQIHRQIGSGDYRTAWYMVMRVRAAMKDDGLAKLLGTVRSVIFGGIVTLGVVGVTAWRIPALRKLDVLD